MVAKKGKARAPEYLESVGWIFFLIVFGVLAAPGVWVGFKIATPESHAIIKVGAGLAVAAFVAAFVAASVNSALQWRAKRIRLANRKKARK